MGRVTLQAVRAAEVVGLLLLALCSTTFGDTIAFNTDTGVMTINGSPATNFFGAPVQSSVIGGVMQFRFLGDLAFIGSDVVGATGSRPLSLFAGNDVRVGPGAIFNFNAGGQVGKLGGGSGGGSVSGGSGGPGGNGGIFGIVSAGGTGAVPFGAASTDGSMGGTSSVGNPGTAGTDGSGGQGGAGGFNNPAGSGPGGSAGTGSVPGNPSSVALGGAGGPRGLNVAQGSGGDGQPGVIGDAGSTGGNAPAGPNGGPGVGGRNEINGLILNGGGGGSSGGSGGGGGGGAGGTGGGDGGGGGGGGVGVIVFGEAGGSGGLGGFGGFGGQGGNGSAGGSSGPGGSGGGAVEIVAQGRLNFAGSISVRGAAAGGRGVVAAPQSGASGVSGGTGFAGSTSLTGLGGDGGMGGPGGNGGAGGNGGSGGGAGGTMMFKSTFFNAAEGTIDASGGASLGSAGGIGRYVVSDNGAVAPNYGTQVGVLREEHVGKAARDLNPYISGGTTTTFNIVDLAGGADVYGIKSAVTATDAYFQQIRVGAPAGAVAAVVRRATGPSPDEQYVADDLLMLVNLTDQLLVSPRLGVGAPGSGFSVTVGQRGFANNELFGGAGPLNFSHLAVGAVFATLVPRDAQFLAMEVNARAGGAVMTPTTFGGLNVAYLLPPPNFLAADFNHDGNVDASDLSAWKTGFGKTGNAVRTDGDADGDQDVDGADFLAWQRQLGQLPTSIPGAASVPEPTANVVCLGLIFSIVIFSQRRRAKPHSK
jgi:hypothetical protein